METEKIPKIAALFRQGAENAVTARFGGSDAPLNEPNPRTFYGRGDDRADSGYTDDPFLD